MDSFVTVFYATRAIKSLRTSAAFAPRISSFLRAAATRTRINYKIQPEHALNKNKPGRELEVGVWEWKLAIVGN